MGNVGIPSAIGEFFAVFALALSLPYYIRLSKRDRIKCLHFPRDDVTKILKQVV